MRVMVFVKSDEEIDVSAPPTAESLAAFELMDRYNEALAEAGIFVAAAGLRPSAAAKRVVCEGADRTVVDGPFTEARELVAGFYIWEVKDMDEAVSWATRCPNTGPGRSELELRPFFEAADLVEAGFVSPEELVAEPREGERGKLGVA